MEQSNRLFDTTEIRRLANEQDESKRLSRSHRASRMGRSPPKIAGSAGRKSQITDYYSLTNQIDSGGSDYEK